MMIFTRFIRFSDTAKSHYFFTDQPNAFWYFPVTFAEIAPKSLHKRQVYKGFHKAFSILVKCWFTQGFIRFSQCFTWFPQGFTRFHRGVARFHKVFAWLHQVFVRFHIVSARFDGISRKVLLFLASQRLRAGSRGRVRGDFWESFDFSVLSFLIMVLTFEFSPSRPRPQFLCFLLFLIFTF